MIEIFKTMEGKVLEQIDTVEKECWISMTNPTPQEIHQISSVCQVEEDVLRAALDAEERARIEAEDDYTLILIDIPAVEKEIVEKQEKDRYITMPLAIVHLDDYIITVCLVETPVLTQLRTGRIKGFPPIRKPGLFYRFFTELQHSFCSICVPLIGRVKPLKTDCTYHRKIKNCLNFWNCKRVWCTLPPPCVLMKVSLKKC